MNFHIPALILSLSIAPLMFGCASHSSSAASAPAPINRVVEIEEALPLPTSKLIIPANRESWVDLALVDAQGSPVVLGHVEAAHGCFAQMERVSEFGGEVLRVHTDSFFDSCDIKLWSAWSSHHVEVTIRYEWSAPAKARVALALL